MGTAKDAANRFYDAWRNKDMDLLKASLTEGVTFEGSLATFENRAQFLEMGGAMMPMIAEFRIHHQMECGEHVCTFYDMVLNTPGGAMTIPMAE